MKESSYKKILFSRKAFNLRLEIGYIKLYFQQIEDIK